MKVKGKMQVFARIMYLPSDSLRARLNGLTPVCSHCGQWRDQNGHWRDVTIYVQKDENPQFTHGICPACLKKHFPEVYAEMMAEKRTSEADELRRKIEEGQTREARESGKKRGPSVEL